MIHGEEYPLDVGPGLAGVGVATHLVQRLALAVGDAEFLGDLTFERDLHLHRRRGLRIVTNEAHDVLLLHA